MFPSIDSKGGGADFPTGSDILKTATFVIKDAVFPARKTDYDVIFKSTGDEAVLSFVRIIRLD